MKSKAYLILAAILVVLVSGCASGPSFRDYESSIPPLSEDAGRIYMYRTAVVGAAVQPKVRVDGEPVGKATPQGFFFVDLPPGDYEISASTEAKRSLTLTLDQREIRYVRLEMKMGFMAGHVKPVLVDDSIGREEILGTKYTGE
ncbi:DUF2846 domain-containing protein [Wenzhouxiangella sp. EGI_FJ10409]|uniref:DUF2846 domain-containing protein n=1 Tax=Wenzhouxiangella sp. EGI_FJ10409 TaxID=3243767 RepID=UPI0035E06FBA